MSDFVRQSVGTRHLGASGNRQGCGEGTVPLGSGVQKKKNLDPTDTDFPRGTPDFRLPLLLEEGGAQGSPFW